MAKIIVYNGHFYGEYCNVKTLPTPGATVAAYDRRRIEDGGKGSNVAAAIGRLGGSVAYINRCGNDEGGLYAMDCLGKAGVELDHLFLDPSVATNTGLCIVAEDGKNIILNFMDNGNYLTAPELDRCLEEIPDAEYIITGFEVPPDTALHALKTGHARGLHTILNPSPLEEGMVPEDLSFVDTLVVNEIEAAFLLGRPAGEGFDHISGAASLRERYGVRNVLITLGEVGSYILCPAGSYFAPAYPTQAVDTVGAGDGYLAALVWRLSLGDGFQQAMDWAGRYASYVCSHMGTLGVYPTFPELEEFLQR